MPRLSQDIRNQAKGMIRAGMTVRGDAGQLNVNKNTVDRIVQRHRALRQLLAISAKSI